MPWLPDGSEERYLETLSEKFARGRIDLRFYPAEEWTLATAGVANPLDTIYFQKMRKAGYTHLLLIRELSLLSAPSYAYFTGFERQMENHIGVYRPTWSESGNECEVLLQLVDLSTGKVSYGLTAKTRISALIIRDDRGGERHVNTSSVGTARYKAIRKGSNRLIEACLAE